MIRPLDTVDRLTAALDYHQARHAVLSTNLANVDTPNYRPHDLERTDSFQSQFALALKATDARHAGLNPTHAAETRVITDNATPADQDGNAVSLDRETVKITANHVRYETIATLVSAELGMLAYAASDARGA